MKTYQQLWQSLTPLYDAGEAQAIVRTVLDVKYGMTLTDIICGKVNELSTDEGEKLEAIVKRLQHAEPVQYILGEADFAGRTFHVEPGVLIPRPETAELCQWIKEDGIAPRILDICTGSGCIAITLALDMPNAEKIEGWDISEDAIRIAKANAETLGARNVDIKYRDALQLIEQGAEQDSATEKWDVIVSNPPYICEKEKADMAPNVLDYEPDIALFVPNEDPLRFYRSIAQYASQALKPGGRLYFEINPIYETEMREMLSHLHASEIETRKDTFGKKRMMKAMFS